MKTKIKSLNFAIRTHYVDGEFQSSEWQIGSSAGTTDKEEDMVKVYEDILSYVTNKLDVGEALDYEEAAAEDSSEEVASPVQETSS